MAKSLDFVSCVTRTITIEDFTLMALCYGNNLAINVIHLSVAGLSCPRKEILKAHPSATNMLAVITDIHCDTRHYIQLHGNPH